MKDVSFALDTKEGSRILQEMAMPVVKKSAEAISSRANGIASSISSQAPSFEVTTKVGTIRRGTRAIATVKSNGRNARQNYVAHVALSKAKDAGKLS